MNVIKTAESLQESGNKQTQISTCKRCGQGKLPFKYKQCPICNLAVDEITYLVTAERQPVFFKIDRLGIEEYFRGIKEVQQAQKPQVQKNQSLSQEQKLDIGDKAS